MLLPDIVNGKLVSSKKLKFKRKELGFNPNMWTSKEEQDEIVGMILDLPVEARRFRDFCLAYDKPLSRSQWNSAQSLANQKVIHNRSI